MVCRRTAAAIATLALILTSGFLITGTNPVLAEQQTSGQAAQQDGESERGLSVKKSAGQNLSQQDVSPLDAPQEGSPKDNAPGQKTPKKATSKEQPSEEDTPKEAASKVDPDTKEQAPAASKDDGDLPKVGTLRVQGGKVVLPPSASERRIQLVLAVDSDPSTTEETIKEALQGVLDYCTKHKGDHERLPLGGCHFAVPKELRSIDVSAYNKLSSALNVGKDGDVDGGLRGGAPEMLVWYERAKLLGMDFGPQFILKKVGVVFKSKGKDNVTENYEFNSSTGKGDTPVSKSSVKSPLRFFSAGRYQLELPTRSDGRLPVQLNAEGMIQGEKKSFQQSIENSRVYWLITLDDFIGNPDALFTMLASEDVQPSELRVERPPLETVLVVGKLLELAPRPGIERMEGNDYIVEIEKIRGKHLKRVWMLFPLTKADRDQYLSEYSQLEGKALLKKVEDNRHAADAKGEMTLSPEDAQAPKWIDLLPNNMDPERVTRFTRRLHVDRIKEWKRAAQGPTYRLIVWEFDNGTTKSVKKVQHPIEEGTVSVYDEEARKWLAGNEPVAK